MIESENIYKLIHVGHQGNITRHILMNQNQTIPGHIISVFSRISV